MGFADGRAKQGGPKPNRAWQTLRALAESSGVIHDAAKDRDGVYKRRGHWHFDYKDPQTGQWQSKTTGKTHYNDAKEFKHEFLRSLNGQYNPGNDRLRFADAADDLYGASPRGGIRRYRASVKRAIASGEEARASNGPVDLKLKDFEDIRLIRTYQQKRIREGVGPIRLNRARNGPWHSTRRFWRTKRGCGELRSGTFR
jgi:hypothetical protein